MNYSLSFKSLIKESIYRKPKTINELAYNFNVSKLKVKKAITLLKKEGRIIMRNDSFMKNPFKIKKEVEDKPKNIQFIIRFCEICFKNKTIPKGDSICFDCLSEPNKTYICKCGTKSNDRYYECKNCKPILDAETYNNDLDYFISDKENDL